MFSLSLVASACRSKDGSTAIRDPKGQITHWLRDVQGRTVDKLYADGRKISYAYQPLSGRLASMTQPNDQGGGTPTVAYAYNAAGQPVGEDYGDASMDDVTYAYADSLGRMSGMTDGIGTTAYSYHPVASAGAGSLDQVDGPWANDTVAYLHDTMGRMHRREIRNDDQSVSSFVEYDFDTLGRVETTTDNLGVHEVTAFDGDTARPLGIESKLSAAGATVVERTYAYTDTNSGKRLASIANETGADALLSTFAYSYSPTGQITDWTRNLAGQGTTTWKIDYDPLYQLKDVTVTDGSGTEVDRYAYHYDAAGNRTGEAIGTAGAFASHNVRNQKTQVGGDGTTLIEGTVDEPSSVTVDGEPVAVRALPGGSEYLYQKEVSMTQGPNTFEIVAEDGSGNTENKTYSVEVSGANKILAYDANGNMLSETDQSNGIVKRYEWDSMNRLLAVQSHDPPQAGAQRVEYRYDGLGRRVGRTVKNWSGSAWAVSQDNSYLWCGTELCQKRDSSGGQVLANYSGFGTEKIVAGVSEKRWFTRDHLGSVREVVDETGAVKARYDYDPWGRRSKLEGTEEAEFGFTGHFYDAASELHLTLLRAYDADLGRWLSADPLGERGGLNLYGYVGNDPVNGWDPFGLEVQGYYNVGAGTLRLVDTDQGIDETFQGCTSGDPNTDHVNNPDSTEEHNLGPIPYGRYRVSLRATDYAGTGLPGYFLQAMDATPNDDVHDASGRNEFRMHQGSGIGCITREDFDRIAEIMEGTTPGPDITDPWGNQNPRLGFIDVFSATATSVN
ncbi:MAG: RHS repeat-associated core domain-containing protein [Verrucomicrobiales bacterium]